VNWKGHRWSKHQREALEREVQGWEKVEGTDRQWPGDLCDLDDFAGCMACPVARVTGLPDCDGTPYYKLSEYARKPRAKSAEVKRRARVMLGFTRRVKRAGTE